MKGTGKLKIVLPKVLLDFKEERKCDGSPNWVDKHIENVNREIEEKFLERPSLIMASVPYSIYTKLAPILGIDAHKKARSDDSNRCKIAALCNDDEEVEEFIHLVETELGIRSGASVDERVEVGTLENSSKSAPTPRVAYENPYLRFLKRSRAKSESHPKKDNLSRRSQQITYMIIRDFLEWFKSIGGKGDEMTIDENVLQDLFQIGFDSPTARAIELRIKEMPVVPENLALLREEPEFALKKGLKTLIKMDIELEKKRPKMYAFGTMLPKEEPPLRFQPPRNEVRKTWTECERVPSELQSLKVVWEGIENLRSTIAFSNWLKNHPEIPPPQYLAEKGLMNVNYEEWMQMFKGFEKDVESEGADLDSRHRDIPEGMSEPTVSSHVLREDMYDMSSFSMN